MTSGSGGPSVRLAPAMTSGSGGPSVRLAPAMTSGSGGPSVRLAPAMTSGSGGPSVRLAPAMDPAVTASAHQGASALQDRTRTVAAPIAQRLWRFHLEGFDRLPAIGAAILCPNHVSFLDSAFLMLLLPRRISFVGKAEYMDSWKTKYL